MRVSRKQTGKAFLNRPRARPLILREEAEVPSTGYLPIGSNMVETGNRQKVFDLRSDSIAVLFSFSLREGLGGSGRSCSRLPLRPGWLSADASTIPACDCGMGRNPAGATNADLLRR